MLNMSAVSFRVNGHGLFARMMRKMARAVLPRREAKKRDKRERIRAAAAELFRARGYDQTTTREIAEHAGVATGTLFLYARHKDEALALVFGDDVDAALGSHTKSRPARLRFVAGLTHRLSGLYALYARDPELALRFVRRLPMLDDREKVAHDALNQRFVAVIRDEVARAVASGELRSDLDADLATHTLFAVVRVLIFGWLALPPVNVEAGRRELARTLRLLVAGMGA
jgi:AcrR family transcriptional regulator